MPDFLFLFFMGFFLFAFVYGLYSLIHYCGNQYNKNVFTIYFCIKGSKSSNALLLGGLPLSLGIFIAYFLSRPLELFSAPEMAFSLSLGLIVLYGYFDDRYELRSLVKLTFQKLSVFIFSLAVASQIDGNLSSFAFVAIFIFGMGAVNGANLLDGIDSLTVKTSSVVLACYAFFSIGYGYENLATLTILLFLPIAAFYFFNRPPAEIHLGEIGGAALGLTFFMMSCSLYLFLVSELGHSPIQAMFTSILPLSIYGTEVFVSFSRRVLRGGSPFCGDQLHAHHILRNDYKLSVKATSNIISIFFLSVIVPASLLIYYDLTPSYLVAIGTFLLLSCCQYLLCRHSWFKNKASQVIMKDFLRSLQKDKVTLIDTSISQKFTLSIKESDHQNEDNNDKKDQGAA